MKESLEILGFILCVTLVFILAMFASMKISAETPINTNPQPPVPEDHCWYAEECPNL